MVMHWVRKACLSIWLATSFCTVAVVALVPVSASAQEARASGEVRRVNPEAGRITIKHGAIPDLQLPAMTLIYHAQPSLLQGLAPGDKIRFSAKRENDRYVVTEISR